MRTAQSSFDARTARAGRAVDLPSPVTACRTAPQVRCGQPGCPTSLAPKSAAAQSSGPSPAGLREEDRTLAFEVPWRPRHRILRWNQNTYRHIIRHLNPLRRVCASCAATVPITRFPSADAAFRRAPDAGISDRRVTSYPSLFAWF